MVVTNQPIIARWLVTGTTPVAEFFVYWLLDLSQQRKPYLSLWKKMSMSSTTKLHQEQNLSCSSSYLRHAMKPARTPPDQQQFFCCWKAFCWLHIGKRSQFWKTLVLFLLDSVTSPSSRFSLGFSKKASPYANGLLTYWYNLCATSINCLLRTGERQLKSESTGWKKLGVPIFLKRSLELWLRKEIDQNTWTSMKTSSFLSSLVRPRLALLKTISTEQNMDASFLHYLFK